MRKSKEFVGIWVFSLLGVLIGGRSVMVLVHGATAQGGRFGRVLASGEMVGTFGDGGCMCKKEYDCTDKFKTGASSCGKCMGQGDRWVCCSGGSASCDLDGTDDTCGTGFDFKKGDIDGTAGSCGTCNSSGELSVDGNCDGKKDATSSETCS